MIHGPVTDHDGEFCEEPQGGNVEALPGVTESAVSDTLRILEAIPLRERPSVLRMLQDSTNKSSSRKTDRSLPALKIDFAGDESNEGRHRQVHDQAPLEWTVVVNLTDNLVPKTDGEGTYTPGAENKAEQLKQLAASTTDKPLTIIVQEVERNPNVPSGDDSKQSGCILKRYAIHGGKITELGVLPSKGCTQDLSDLLKYATQSSPSEKIALINQSHGFAQGVGGATG